MRVRIAAASVALLASDLAGCARGGPVSDPSPSTPLSSLPPSTVPATRGPIIPTGTPADVPADRWTAIEEDLIARAVTGTLRSSRPRASPSTTAPSVPVARTVVHAGARRRDAGCGLGRRPLLRLPLRRGAAPEALHALRPGTAPDGGAAHPPLDHPADTNSPTRTLRRAPRGAENEKGTGVKPVPVLLIDRFAISSANSLSVRPSG